MAPAQPMSSAVTASPALLVATTILPKRSRISARSVVRAKNSHNLAGNGDIVTGLAGEAALLGSLANRDAAQHAVVDIDHSAPGQGFGIDIQAHKTGNLFLGQIIGIGFVDTQFLETLEHRQSELAAAVLGRRAEAAEEGLIALAGFVVHAGVDGRGQQVIGRCDGMNITRQVQVEIFHGHALAVATTGSAALNPEGWSLRWLTDSGEYVFTDVGT